MRGLKSFILVITFVITYFIVMWLSGLFELIDSEYYNIIHFIFFHIFIFPIVIEIIVYKIIASIVGIKENGVSYTFTEKLTGIANAYSDMTTSLEIARLYGDKRTKEAIELEKLSKIEKSLRNSR